MRAITTNWNSTTYAETATFVDKVSGNAVVIPALNPMNHRSMIDSVDGGAYVNQPDGFVLSDETLATAPEDEDVVTVTVSYDSVAISGVAVKAVSDDTDVATVTPASTYTDEDGVASFTVVSVGDGEATISFTCGTATDDCVVTVTTP